jgi:hypothetical protein
MASDRRLLQLSTLIQTNTTTIDTYMRDNGITEPSFGPKSPPIVHFPPDIERARGAVLEALDELRDHLLGPVRMVTKSVTDVRSRCHYV